MLRETHINIPCDIRKWLYEKVQDDHKKFLKKKNEIARWPFAARNVTTMECILIENNGALAG